MTAISLTNVNVYEQDTGLSQEADSPYVWKEILVEVPSTADTGNTITLDLTKYGITNPKAIKGWRHGESKSYSEVLVEAPTTAGPGTSYVITIAGSYDDAKRVYWIGGY